ncbi:MAG: penicillin-binding protein 2, partial [Armatimonadetes bacterium]|nr:penicillin-binding protein 2 [Armatimonadota bacterium]
MSSRKRAFVRKRAIWLSLGFITLFGAIAGKLVFIQLCRADEYSRWAQLIRFRQIPIPASRGAIFDRAGRPLAVSIRTVSIYANPREVKDSSLTAARLTHLIGGDQNTYRRKIEGTKHIVWLAKNIDPFLGEKIRRGWKVVSDGETHYERLDGIGVQRDFKRVYPAGTIAAQVLGFTSFYGSGLEGVECVMDSVLTGREGIVEAELDARRRIIVETKRVIRKPRNGKDVYLTIDLNIQHIAEQAIARMAQTFHPDHACAIVMDPHTGDILALANYPSFDPNNALKFPAYRWRNRAVADLYEPGSTLKVVTVAAALNEGFSTGTVFAQCKGRERIKGGYLPCSLHHPFENGHGAVTLAKIIHHSCNIGAGHVAMRLGAQRLRKYEEAFGLLERPRAGFGCEAVGSLAPANKWPLIRLANIGFGQGISVTPLQMASVYATIANGGVYVCPRIIREIRDQGHVCVYAPAHRSRRVISSRAAEQLTKMLVG